MDVVIMQARDDGLAGGVVDLLTGARCEGLLDGRDLFRDTDVDDCAVEQRRPLNQQGTNRRCLISSSTSSLSAPSRAAVADGCGVMAHGDWSSRGNAA